MNEQSKTGKKLTGSIVTVVLLAVCLCITTFALVYSTVAVEDNIFQTGTVKINLNDGKPVINEQELLFEPGMTVEKDFFIENQSSIDVYFRLYFDNIEGELANLLQVSVKDGDKLLYRGKINELSRDDVTGAEDSLKLGERRELTISFNYPETVGNEGQSLYLTFDLKADAVQTKNNPDRLFD